MSDKQRTAYQRLLGALVPELQNRFNGFLFGCAGDITRALVQEFIQNGFGVKPMVVLIRKDGSFEGVVPADYVDAE